jgi:hypothetical protein
MRFGWVLKTIQIIEIGDIDVVEIVNINKKKRELGVV